MVRRFLLLGSPEVSCVGSNDDPAAAGRPMSSAVVSAVSDRCCFDGYGTVFSAWPGGDFDALLKGQNLLISVARAELEAVDGPFGHRIARTGATRICG